MENTNVTHFYNVVKKITLDGITLRVSTELINEAEQSFSVTLGINETQHNMGCDGIIFNGKSMPQGPYEQDYNLYSLNEFTEKNQGWPSGVIDSNYSEFYVNNGQCYYFYLKNWKSNENIISNTIVFEYINAKLDYKIEGYVTDVNQTSNFETTEKTIKLIFDYLSNNN